MSLGASADARRHFPSRPLATETVLVSIPDPSAQQNAVFFPEAPPFLGVYRIRNNLAVPKRQWYNAICKLVAGMVGMPVHDYDAHDRITRLAIILKFIYSVIGLILGLVCILSGVVLGLAGVVDKTTWVASALGLSTSLTDAPPGVIVFVVGIFVVLITRFRYKDGYGPFGRFHHMPSIHHH